MIVSLAIAGTLISALIVGYVLYGLEYAGLLVIGGPLVALLFGSLISATDPVATLAVFSSLKVDRTLYSIVFGEAVMNDAVAIALYQTFLGFVDDPDFTAGDLFIAIGMFVAKFLGSFVIGCLIGVGSSLFFKHADVRSPVLVTAFVVTIGYVTFALNEGILLSGIIAIFFLGITMRHYAMENVGEEMTHTTENFLQSMAYICESLIYVYIGESAFSVTHVFDTNFILFSILLILIGRVHVFPILGLANRRREKKIEGRIQFMTWYAGLRGAIAFTLALLLPETIATRSTIITTTFVIVLATTVIIGASTVPVLRSLKIKINDDPSKDPPSEDLPRLSSKSLSLAERFENFDRDVLHRVLTTSADGHHSNVHPDDVGEASPLLDSHHR